MMTRVERSIRLRGLLAWGRTSLEARASIGPQALLTSGLGRLLRLPVSGHNRQLCDPADGVRHRSHEPPPDKGFISRRHADDPSPVGCRRSVRVRTRNHYHRLLAIGGTLPGKISSVAIEPAAEHTGSIRGLKNPQHRVIKRVVGSIYEQ